MKAPVAFAVLTAVILFGGCASVSTHRFPNDISQVHLGMSKKEATELLGSPSDAATGIRYEGMKMLLSGVSEVFLYQRSCRGEKGAWIVVFVDEKVTEYGPLVGLREERYGEIFLRK